MRRRLLALLVGLAIPLNVSALCLLEGEAQRQSLHAASVSISCVSDGEGFALWLGSPPQRKFFSPKAEKGAGDGLDETVLQEPTVPVHVEGSCGEGRPLFARPIYQLKTAYRI